MRESSRYGRWLISTGAGVLMMTSGICAQPPAGPWAKTVPLPTACYSSQDHFADKNAAALEVVSAEASAQQAANDEISHNLSAEAGKDPMAMAARIQEQMMKDPQAAMKLMQQAGAAEDPEAAQAKRLHAIDRQQQMEAEGKDLIKRYHAAVQAALVPPRAHYATLKKKLGITGDSWGVGETGAPAWAYAEWDTVKREADQAYAAMCPQWWGATGAMQAFMKRYKDYLVNERIPFDEENASKGKAALSMSTASTGSYKSTAVIDAIRDHMKLAGRLYGERHSDPICAGNTCRDIGGI
jgi:hypothetical protein